MAFIVDFGPEVFAIADAETSRSLPNWDFGGEWSSGGSSHRLRDRSRMRYYIYPKYETKETIEKEREQWRLCNLSRTTARARDNPGLPFGERGQIFVVSHLPVHGGLGDVRVSRTHVKHFEGERWINLQPVRREPGGPDENDTNEKLFSVLWSLSASSMSNENPSQPSSPNGKRKISECC